MGVSNTKPEPVLSAGAPSARAVAKGHTPNHPGEKGPIEKSESVDNTTPGSTLNGSGEDPLGDRSPADSLDPEAAEITKDTKIETNLQLVTKALDVTDDPTENPYTLRAFVIGLSLSAFGAVLAEIFYFKPQTVGVSSIFLVIISFCFGEATLVIPKWGPIGRLLNPGPFNQKEHVFIVVMASTAATCALGTEQLAVQSLYYNQEPNAASAIFMLFSSQCIGYGLLGIMRKAFVYPTKYIWPSVLPRASTFQAMHIHKHLAKERMHIFWWVCLAIAVWELVPQYMMPLTVGVSIFCLANQHSELFTYLFGGSNGNEGMGFLSWSMDWMYIGAGCMVMPINTLFNQLIGYLGCVVLTVAAYYANLWNAKNFPFLAQVLFTADGNQYNQSMIMGANNEVDTDLLAAYGLPWFATSQALSLLVFNMGITAAIVHIFLWNWDDVKFVFDPFKPASIKSSLRDLTHPREWNFWRSEPGALKSYPGTECDGHFQAMQAYKDAPSWWYNLVLVLSMAIGLVCCYQQNTGLPWWAFFIAVGLGWFLTIFFASMEGIVGFSFPPTSAIQMIGGYLVPRRPVANMMFTLYGSNSLGQAMGMLADLKLAQYAKLPPRATFAAQMIGTCVGAVLNWAMMNSIVKNQREILLSVEGTTVWSGQNVQTYNAQAVSWGGTSSEIFGRHGTYWMVPMGLVFGLFAPLPFVAAHRYFPKLGLDRYNTFIICTWLGYLSVGINSSLLPYFVFGFFAQGYLRRYKPVFFAKWNLIIAAGISGGVAVIAFLLTFAVNGGAGVERPFPAWWGNNVHGNADRCRYMNGGD